MPDSESATQNQSKNALVVHASEKKFDFVGQCNLHGLDFPSHYQQFFNITNETLDRHAPLKTKTVSSKKSVPWLDSEYKTERALRRKYERAWKESVKKSGKTDTPERVPYVTQRKKCANHAWVSKSFNLW